MTNIYNDWQDILTVGVARKICEDDDDSKFAVFDREYKKQKKELIASEINYGGSFTGFEIA